MLHVNSVLQNLRFEEISDKGVTTLVEGFSKHQNLENLSVDFSECYRTTKKLCFRICTEFILFSFHSNLNETTLCIKLKEGDRGI